MKRFILLVLFMSIVYSQEKNIELEVIYEKTFDEPIVDVIFDTATVKIEEAKRMGWKNLEGRKNNEKIKIDYPKVVFVAEAVYPMETQIKEIQFLGRDGKIKKRVDMKELKGEQVITSSNGKYILIKRLHHEDYPEIQGGILFNNDGIEIWRKDEGPYPVAVSNEGYVVAQYPGYGEEPPGDFVLYNPEGKELKRIQNPLAHLPIGWSSAKFSEDGEYIVLNFSDYDSTGVLITVDKNGNLIGYQEFKYSVTVFAVKKEKIFGTLYKIIKSKAPYLYEIYLFCANKNCTLNWKKQLEIGGVREMELSHDKSKIFVISGAGYLWCFDVSSGNSLWKYKTPWAPMMESEKWPIDVPRFREIGVIDNKVYVKGNYSSFHHSLQKWYASSLFIFDLKNGNLIQKIEYPDKKITLISKEDKLFISEIDSKKLFGIKLKE